MLFHSRYYALCAGTCDTSRAFVLQQHHLANILPTSSFLSYWCLNPWSNLLLVCYRAIRIATPDSTPIIGGSRWWMNSRPPAASTAIVFRGTPWCMCPSLYMLCPLLFSLTATPYLHRTTVHARHWYSVLTLTALTHRYSVLPVWTSAGDPAPSALQAPFPTSQLCP